MSKYKKDEMANKKFGGEKNEESESDEEATPDSFSDQ